MAFWNSQGPALFLLLLLIFNAKCIDDTVENQITDLIAKMSTDDKVKILHGDTMFTSPGVNGIKGFTMSDGPHGARYGHGSTAFPTTISLTATWDPEYMEVVGQAYGREHRGVGTNMALGPAVDIGRNPIAGRASETIGEEPFLGGKVFAGFTRGVQSTKLIACVKHFLAQNHDGDRDNTNPKMDARTMREFYGLPFRLNVQEGGVYSVMSAYNLVNNKHCSQNDDSLNKMLKQEWGYEYFVVSDWWGTYDSPQNLINNGLDMEMPDGVHYNQLVDAVNSGQVQQDTLNTAVRRTLRARFASGMMDPNTPPGKPSDVGSAENQEITLEAARRSLVLLKNDNNILPLSKKTTIALIGPNAANNPITSFGSSEITEPAPITNIKDALSRYITVSTRYVKGCDINSGDTGSFANAKQAAQQAQFVVFVGGLDNTQEGEAYGERSGQDRTGMSVMLPGQQLKLIEELASVNPNIIVVLHSGGIVSLGTTADKVKGIIYGFYCGNKCGQAVVEALLGDYNPGGKLPIAMPLNDQQLPAWNNLDFTDDMIAGFGYRKFDKTGEKPIFNFGHGLSYTSFSLSNLAISDTSVNGQDGVTVSIDIKNTGKLKGDEVIQLYLSQKVSVPMPKKQLRAFKRVTLEVGESKTVKLVLTPHELSYWSTNLNHYYVEKGEYTAWVGTASDNLPLSVIFNVVKEYSIPYPGEEPPCDNCPATGIQVTPTTLNVGLGSTGQVNAKVLPANATNKGVKFSSSAPTIATVSSSGQVSGLAVGSSTITATSDDGGFTGSATVSVIKSVCPEWVQGVNYKTGSVVSYQGNTYTSNNDWTGSAPDPYTATHTSTGWGWTIGGTCSVLEFDY